MISKKNRPRENGLLIKLNYRIQEKISPISRAAFSALSEA